MKVNQMWDAKYVDFSSLLRSPVPFPLVLLNMQFPCNTSLTVAMTSEVTNDPWYWPYQENITTVVVIKFPRHIRYFFDCQKL